MTPRANKSPRVGSTAAKCNELSSRLLATARPRLHFCLYPGKAEIARLSPSFPCTPCLASSPLFFAFSSSVPAGATPATPGPAPPNSTSKRALIYKPLALANRRTRRGPRKKVTEADFRHPAKLQRRQPVRMHRHRHVGRIPAASGTQTQTKLSVRMTTPAHPLCLGAQRHVSRHQPSGELSLIRPGPHVCTGTGQPILIGL